MHPTLLNIFGMRFHAYATMLAVAFLVGTLSAVRDLNRKDPPIAITTLSGIWAFAGALIGAKAFWIIQYDSIGHLWRVAYFWESGLVFYGGLIGAMVGMFGYLKVAKLPVLPVADACAPYVALGEAITRIGCFLNGCCWGRVSEMPWALSFPRFSPAFDQQVHDHLLTPSAGASLPVHPTQLYMVAGLLIAFGIMVRAARRTHRAGEICVMYFFLYGVVRFTVEIFRGDCARSVFSLTVSQAISLGLMIAGLAGLMVMRQRKTAAIPVEEGADAA